jgi:hypothetical protein
MSGLRRGTHANRTGPPPARDVIKDEIGGKLLSGRPRASAFTPRTRFYPDAKKKKKKIFFFFFFFVIFFLFLLRGW